MFTKINVLRRAKNCGKIWISDRVKSIGAAPGSLRKTPAISVVLFAQFFLLFIFWWIFNFLESWFKLFKELYKKHLHFCYLPDIFYFQRCLVQLRWKSWSWRDWRFREVWRSSPGMTAILQACENYFLQEGGGETVEQSLATQERRARFEKLLCR